MAKHLKIIFILIILGILYYSVSLSLHNKTFLKIVAEAVDNLSHIEFYQSLANPTVKYVNIQEGMRKEQIAAVLSDTLKWDEKDVEDFLGYDNLRSAKFEGKYYPNVYLIPRTTDGIEMKRVMNQRFLKKTSELESKFATTTLNMDRVLTIASIIQREAAGKSDMKLISGVIWNRLWKGMSLQMDATLQYVKGNEDNGWWPKVVPADKKLKSPYNTYMNEGLPPSPIANPGLAAIEAALNPQKTECLYYFHKSGVIYCSATYAEHRRKIDLYLK
jgi:UPF0755 protein